MKRIAWLTDLHLEFLQTEQVHTFIGHLINNMPDIVLVGGDTGTAGNFVSFLKALEKRLEHPIYFVLGNHDYYYGSIKEVRAIADNLSKSSHWLKWLPVQGIVPISETTCLIGHGSWADGRLGNGKISQVELNDYYLIKELSGLSQQERFTQLEKLGDQSANYFRKLLPQACTQFSEIILLTHVPPFRDACWHEGKVSNDEYLPHFACKVVGDLFLDVMRKYTECKLTVLCGHTHSKGEVDILPNLYVKTGSAQYGHPCLQELLIIE